MEILWLLYSYLTTVNKLNHSRLPQAAPWKLTGEVNLLISNYVL